MTSLRAILVMVITVLALCPHSLAAQAYTMSALQVSPDGSTIAVGLVDGYLQLHDSTTGTVIQTLQQPGEGEGAYHLAWSPDGENVAAITFNGEVMVWDAQTGARLVSLNTIQAADIIPRTGSLTGVSWSPDGQQIAVSGQNGGTVIIDASTGSAVHRLENGETYGNTWSPSQNLVTIAIAGLYVWNNGVQIQYVPSIAFTQYPGFIPSIATYAPNGDSLAAIVTDYSLVGDNVVATGVLRLFDPVTLNPIASVDTDMFQGVARVRMEWSHDSTHIAISGTDGFVRVWEAASLELIDEIAIGNSYMAFDWLSTDQIVYVQDNGSLVVEPVEGIATDLTGAITLPSRTPGTAAYAVDLSVKLADSGGLVSEHSPTTDVNGYFTLQDLPQGAYGVWLKHAQSLAVMPSVNLDAPAVSLDFGTLAMGDADNSNSVNISDFSLLSAAYGKSQGQSGYDARADFNGDNSVGITDFSLLSSSYGLFGAPQPGIGGMGAFAAPPSTGTVTVLLRPAAARARVGQEFTVTLRIRAGGQTVAGAAAYLTFDPALLQVVAVTPGSALPEVLQSAYDNASGHVDYGAGALTDPPRGTFTLAAVRFRAVAPTPGATIQLAVGDPTRVTDVRYGDQTVYGGGESVSVVVE